MEMSTRIVLKADEGKILTDGIFYGRTVMLGEGRTVDEFHEITKEEYEKIEKEEIIE